jgi:CrcB protein
VCGLIGRPRLLRYPDGDGGPPKPLVRADDSCRATIAAGAGTNPPQGGFFVARLMQLTNEARPRHERFGRWRNAIGAHLLHRRRPVSALLWIAFGSALGGMGRYWCSDVVARRFGERFPWGTLVVNVTGSFAIGIFGGLGPEGTNTVDPGIRQFLMVGVCGGYTTFSSFSLQTLALARDRQWREVCVNIVLSTATCLIAVWLGFGAAVAIG